MRADRPVRNVASEVAASGLRSVCIPAPRTDEEWRALLAVVEPDRLGGLLARAIREGEIELPPEQVADAAALHDRAMRWCLRLERRMLGVAAELTDRGVPFRVLKGLAVAHLDYEDPADRVFRDMDLLVPSADLERTVDILTGLGFLPTQVEPRRGFQREFGKGRSTSAPDGVEVDVHRTLAMGPYAHLIGDVDLWVDGAPFALGGQMLIGLDHAWRFVHACLHLTLTGGDRLWIARDVAQLHLSAGLDGRRVLAIIEDHRLTAAVASAIRCSDHVIGVTGPLSAWASDAGISSSEARLLATYGPGRREAERAVASLAVLRGVRPRLRLVRSLVLPDAAFTRSHGVGRARWSLDALRRFVPGRRR